MKSAAGLVTNIPVQLLGSELPVLSGLVDFPQKIWVPTLLQHKITYFCTFDSACRSVGLSQWQSFLMAVTPKQLEPQLRMIQRRR